MYGGFCLNSSTFAVSETASRRWWCIESRFPMLEAPSQDSKCEDASDRLRKACGSDPVGTMGAPIHGTCDIDECI